MATKMHRLQISLPKAQVHFLRERARQEGISAAEVIRRLVEREEQSGSTITQADIDEALSFASSGDDSDVYLTQAHADAPAGRVIKDEAVAGGAALRATEKLLAALSRAEKSQVLQWVARDLGDAFPGIEQTPGVNGGEPCIVRTRIPVWVLVRARELGTSEADLLHAYPTLRAEDLTNAWAYTRVHRSEIQAQIRDNETA